MVWVSSVGKLKIEMRSRYQPCSQPAPGKVPGESSMQVWPLVPIQRSGMDGVSQVRASYRAVSTGRPTRSESSTEQSWDKTVGRGCAP